MAEREPVTDLGPFSSDGAVATQWASALAILLDAEVYWLSTVRPGGHSDGRPHVTPLLGVWLDGAVYFCTGPTERKAKNLAQNPNCVLTTGCNGLDDGLDLVVEGAAAKVSARAELRSVADTFESKYGRHFTVPDGTWFGLGDAIRGGDALVYRVAPSTAFGFGKGRQLSQTRWRFS
jgi:nitroimidazol reductase NimA-like FMN-containing flavoprotein (pyridoxamine 5'-phosphate oxidase superfamily)